MLSPTLVLAAILAGSVDAPLPRFSLENFDGRSFSNASFEGKTTIVVPTYAKCIFACPMITFFLTELDKELGAPPDIQYVHLSVQPTEDTADEIREHFDEHGIDAARDPRWLFVNAPERAVHEFLDDVGVKITRTRVAEGVLIEHTIRVFVVGPRGETLAAFDTYFWDKEAMHHALRYAVQ